MKKIIYIADIRLPTEKAHGIQIMKMCEAFSLKGVNLKLIVPLRFNPIKEDLFGYYNIKKNFEVRKIFSFDLTFFWPIFRSFVFWWQSFWFAIFSFFYTLLGRYDFIYSRDFLPLFFLSFFKKNIIYELHNFPKNPFLYRRFFKNVKKIIVITDKLKDFLIEEGIGGDKIIVSPDGVDLKEFDIKEDEEECRKKLNLPLDKKIIIYTGHLFEWKGAHILAEAVRYLDKDNLIVFVGGMRKDIKNFKERIHNSKNILVIGHQPHSEIPYWLKAADVLILPNSAKEKISQLYTSPLKMFEYMAARKSIVASNLPSIGEILNKNNAILISPDDPLALSKGVKEALKNKDLSDKIIQQAYLDVQNYSWQKRAEKIINFVKNI